VTQQQDASSPEPPPAVDTESAESRGAVSHRQIFLAGPNSSIGKLFGLLGPGLVTGAADDDPSGIATYSQIGAQFGYTLLWTMLFIYPFMTSIQEISARLGRVTGRGIAGNIKCLYSPWILYGIVLLLLFANTINIGADIGAMGAAANLLVGGPTLVYCVLFATLSVLLQVFVPYKAYSSVLKWLTLSLFAYVGTMFAVQINWGQALHGIADECPQSASGHKHALGSYLSLCSLDFYGVLFWFNQAAVGIRVDLGEFCSKK
jgi:Mn2+/Fe2+ NRAMP family transporter